MVLGKRIYNSDGLILLAEGVELTTGLIRRLGTLEIGYVYIEEPMTEDIVVPELLTEETRRRRSSRYGRASRPWRVRSL